jgi:hypothetical protein
MSMLSDSIQSFGLRALGYDGRVTNPSRALARRFEPLSLSGLHQIRRFLRTADSCMIIPRPFRAWSAPCVVLRKYGYIFCDLQKYNHRRYPNTTYCGFGNKQDVGDPQRPKDLLFYNPLQRQPDALQSGSGYRLYANAAKCAAVFFARATGREAGNGSTYVS